MWSLIAGISVYAKNEIFFDVCRAGQGVGSAMLVPNALAILGRTYPPGRSQCSERSRIEVEDGPNNRRLRSSPRGALRKALGDPLGVQ